MASRAAQSAEPERRTPSFSIYISGEISPIIPNRSSVNGSPDLKISGLERTRFKQKPDPVAVIFVDGQNAKETRVQKSTENPQWNEVLEV
jgi:Ca2+-dependent lipid-binding protein